MIRVPIDNITKADVQALVENGVREQRTIEYKVKRPENNDKAKKEFLADVSSFANAAGGDLIFGIEAKDGLPVGTPGLLDFNEDQDQLRLEAVIRDGVAPRILGLRMRVVQGFEKGPVLIIRVSKSWASPHMVTFQGTSRFFTRSSAGKYQMDVGEIRSAFALSEQLPERIKRWRAERLGRIVADEGPMRMSRPSAYVLHLIPLDSFANEYRFSIEALCDARDKFYPLGGRGGWNHRINIDGPLNFKGPADGSGGISYCQIFRSGRIEAVHAGVVRERDGRRQFFGPSFEEEIVDAVDTYLDGLKALDVPPPFVLCVTVLGAKGAFITADWEAEHGPVDRDPLLLPDVLLESYDCDVAREIRPILDGIWNASGFMGSPSYGNDGTWTARH